MKALKPFIIPFKGMSTKVYQFNFKVDKRFFECFENAPYSDCSIEIKLDFDKRENFFHLKFYIDGTVNVPCDRCLELFDQAIFDDYELFVKFGEEEEETDDDVIYINKNDDHIDISKVVYDYILLSVPLKCAHPIDENGVAACNPEVLKKLNTKEKSNEVDPRWAALEKLKYKNN